MSDFTFTHIDKLSEIQTLAPAESNYGRVYQNYISTNLASDDLAKASYDAYNLLSAGKLRDFQKAAVSAINALIENQSTLRQQVSELQQQVSQLQQKLDNLLAGDIVITDLKVKQISFVNTTD